MPDILPSPPRIVLVALTTVALLALTYGPYCTWFYEEPRAIGPLARELNAHFDREDADRILNTIVARHVSDVRTIDARRPLFEGNGFDCVIKAASVKGSRILLCRRPVEGQHYCERINYFAYQTAAGQIIESLAARHIVPQRRRTLGRCPYKSPAIDD